MKERPITFYAFKELNSLPNWNEVDGVEKMREKSSKVEVEIGVLLAT